VGAIQGRGIGGSLEGSARAQEGSVVGNEGSRDEKHDKEQRGNRQDLTSVSSRATHQELHAPVHDEVIA
jgi:hypothetical protein